MTSRDATIVPKPQEPPAYSRLFQDTPYYRPRLGRDTFTTQSVPALAVQSGDGLRESKSSTFLDAPPPRGYEKPVSSSESISRTGDQSVTTEAAGDSSLTVPTIPLYVSDEHEDFITVDQLVEMNHQRQRGGRNNHHYVEQGTSPSTRQLLSSITVFDTEN